MKEILVLLILVTTSFNLSAQNDVFGKWRTIDDETGEVKSVVEIFEKNGEAYGKIVKIFRAPDEEQDPNCKVCPGDRKNKKIIGLEIIQRMEYDADDKEWGDGEILDPEDGKTYDCVIWRDGDKLKVRGYVAFFYRTQTWEKIQ
jgi:uncharacterized protein (DUF2147 family)